MRRLALVFVLSALSAIASGADEFVAPPKAERDVLAAIAKLGGSARVDGEYRLISVTLGTECTNEELKGLAACERLTNLSISSPKITDAGLEHLKGLTKLTKLTTMTIATSGLTTEGIASLRTALPNCRISSFGGGGGGPPGGGSRTRGDGFALPTNVSGSFATGTRITNLARNTEVQDDLKLSPEQRTKISAETTTTTILRALDDKILAVLTPEQQARMKQLELQQAGMNALTREDIVAQLKSSAEQVAAIRKQNDEASTAIRAAQTEYFDQLRNAAAPGNTEVSAKLREKIAELRKQQEEKVLALLGEEQRKTWQALVGPKGPQIENAFSSRSSERGITPAVAAKSTFDRYDTDKDGTLSDAEFPASNRTRTSMSAAGITLVYPVAREVFESNYVKFLEGLGRRDRGR